MTDPYTPLHNNVLEALMKADLPAESRILFVIWRKTFGFQKKEDKISISQFQQITGLPRTTIYNALRMLVLKKIITRTGSTTGFSKEFMRSSAPITKRINRPAILTRDNYICFYCHQKFLAEFLDIDHKIPILRGGTNDLSNLVTACEDCNLDKGIRTSEEYVASHSGFQIPEMEDLPNMEISVPYLEPTIETITKEKDIRVDNEQRSADKKPATSHSKLRPIVNTSYNSLSPLSPDHLYIIAAKKNVPLEAVKRTHQSVLDAVEDGNKYKTKDISRTLQKWLNMRLERGELEPMNEMQRVIFDSHSPEAEKETQLILEKMRRLGI